MKYQKLLVNKFNITLDKQGRLVLNDQKSLCHTMNHRDLFSLFRSSHQRCSVKKGALKKICKFHRKTSVLESLQACNFIKKRLQHWCFLVKFAKNFKNIYFEDNLRKTTSICFTSRYYSKWVIPAKFTWGLELMSLKLAQTHIFC